jgi:hypothetical protein
MIDPLRDPLAQFVVALGLALLFAGSATTKARQFARFTAQLAEYRLLPGFGVPAAAAVITLLEAALALTLPWPALQAPAGLAAASLLLTYATAIAINLWRRRDYIDCGCGDTPVLLTPWLIWRNGILAAGAMSLLLPTAARPLGFTDLWLGLLALGVLIMLYQAVEQLLENASVLREWHASHD